MIIAYFTMFAVYIAIIGVFVLAWWRIWEKTSSACSIGMKMRFVASYLCPREKYGRLCAR